MRARVSRLAGPALGIAVGALAVDLAPPQAPQSAPLAHPLQGVAARPAMAARYALLYGIGVASMLTGAAIVHNIMQPDLVSQRRVKSVALADTSTFVSHARSRCIASPVWPHLPVGPAPTPLPPCTRARQTLPEVRAPVPAVGGGGGGGADRSGQSAAVRRPGDHTASGEARR